MKMFLHALLVSGCLLTGVSPVLALGPEESSCTENVTKSCASSNPEVLAFRKAQVVQLYNELVYPAPLKVLKDPMSAAHLFQVESVTGRVTPLGRFTDFNGVVEYFYALAANVNTHVIATRVTTSMAADDKVAATIELAFCENRKTDCELMSDVARKRNTLVETGFFIFNKQNRIISFDLIIPDLGAVYDIKDKMTQAAVIAGVCAQLTVAHINPISGETVQGGTCTTYFDEQKDFGPGFIAIPGAAFLNCVNYMNSIPFGSFNRGNSDTFTCREVHSLLTPLRPEVHCPHVAYGGGHKCVDFPYETYFEPLIAEPHDAGHMH